MTYTIDYEDEDLFQDVHLGHSKLINSSLDSLTPHIMLSKFQKKLYSLAPKNTKIEKKNFKLLCSHQFLRLRSNILPLQEKN